MRKQKEVLIKTIDILPKRLRIGIFVDLFLPKIDGVAIVVHNLATYLSETADVTVFAPEVNDGGEMPETKYKIVRSNKMKIPFVCYDIAVPYTDSEFMNTLKNADFDIIHIHSPFSMGKIGIKYAIKNNIPVVATLHSQFEMDFKSQTKSKLLTKWMLKKIIRVFNKCDECWAVSEEIVHVFDGYGIKIPIIVHHNGTDLIPIIDREKSVDLMTLHKIKTSDQIFLFVGRLSRLKNVFLIIESLKYLAQQNYAFKMLFIGSGPEEKLMKELVTFYHLEDYIEMVGTIVDRNLLTEYYHLADLFLFPSLYDASSLVQIEAASQHTPTLFLKDAVTAKKITDDKDGYLSDDSPEAYAQRIISIFGDNIKYKEVCDGAFNNLYRYWTKEVDTMKVDYQRLIDSKKEALIIE